MLVTLRNLLSFLSLSSVVSSHPWVSLIHSVHPFWLNNCARPKGSRHVRAVLSELLILPLELYSFSHSPKSCSLFWRDQAFLLLPWSTSAACLHRLEPWSLGSLCPCSAGCRLFSCCRSPAPELIWAYGVGPGFLSGIWWQLRPFCDLRQVTHIFCT